MDPSFIGLPVSGSIIQDYASADPDPKEIFTDILSAKSYSYSQDFYPDADPISGLPFKIRI